MPLTDRITLETVAPKTELPGLDEALKKLKAIDTAIARVNGQMSGLSTHSAFKRTAATMTEDIKASGKGPFAPADVAKTLGMPRPKDFQDYVANFNAHIKELKKAAAEGQKLSAGAQRDIKLSEGLFTNRGGVKGFGSAEKAGTFAARYFRDALREARGPVEAIQTLFGKGLAQQKSEQHRPPVQKVEVQSPKSKVQSAEPGVPPPSTLHAPPSTTSLPVPVTVPAAQIVATLGPGLIPLVVPPGQVSASSPAAGTANGTMGNGVTGNGSGTTKPKGKSPGGVRESGYDPDFVTEVPIGRNAVRVKSTTAPDKAELLAIKEVEEAGKSVEKFWKEVEGGFEESKTIKIDEIGTRLRETAQAKLKAIQNELKGLMAPERGAPSGHLSESIRMRSPNELAMILRKQVELIEGTVKGLRGANLQPIRDKAAALVASLNARAANLEERGASQATKQAIADMKSRGALRQKLDRARQQGQAAAEREAEEELRAFERQVSDRNKMIRAGAKSEERRARSVAATNAERQASQAGEASHAAAMGLVGDLRAKGYTVSEPQTRGKFGARGGQASVTYEATKDEGGFKKTERVRLDFLNGKATTAQVDQLSRKLKETRAEAGAMGGDFIKNTMKVTSWAASVTLLYKTTELARHSMEAMIQVGGQMARLDQVFRQTGGTTQELTSDILGLAAANGRSTNEAMEAAIRWSRLGLTRAQVNEAVRVSLIAANVAQIDANEATEHMSAIMQAYNLNVSDLRTVLAEMNSITNTFNVSNADMLQGLARTAAIAKQAKLPLAELMGLLAGGIGGTGQSGANIGNSIKSVMLALSNPELQKTLRQQYQFEITSGGGGEMKGMSAILSDLYVKYQGLNDLRRQGLLFDIAGKTQASRLAAELDHYVDAQVLAINAQLNMNNADIENAKIKATLKNQLTGLITEWEKFVVVQGQGIGGVGPANMLSGLTEGLHNVLKLLNMGGISPLFSMMLAMGTAVSAKMALTAIQMKNMPGATGFFAKSIQGVSGAMGSLGMMFARSEARMFSKGAHTPWWDSRRSGLGNAFQLATMDPASRAGLGAVDRLGRRIQRGALGQTMRSAALMMPFGSGSMDKVAALFDKGSMAANLFGRSLRGLAVALGLMRNFALIGVAIWGMNKAMEAIGLSSAKAEAKLAGFNAEAQKASEGAAAMAEAANFLTTMQRSLPLARDHQEAARMLKGVAEVSFPNETDAEKHKAKVNAEEAIYLDLLRQEGGLAKVNERMDAQRLALMARAGEMRQQEYVETQRFMKANQAEIDRLNRAAAHPLLGRISADARHREIAEREALQKTKQRRAIAIQVEQTNDLSEKYASDQQVNTALEKQKLVLESIAGLYHGLSANNRYEELGRELAMLEAQQEALQNQSAALKDNRDVLLAGDDARAKNKEKLEAKERSLRGTQTLAEESLGEMSGFTLANTKRGLRVAGAPDADEAELDRRQKVLDDIKAKIHQVHDVELPQSQEKGNSTAEERNRVLQLEAAKAERAGKVKEDATRSEMESERTKQIVRARAGEDEAKGMGLQAHVGITESEKMLAERREMLKLRATLTLQQAAGGAAGLANTGDVAGKSAVLTANQHGQLLEAMNRQQQIANDLRKRGWDLEREISQTIKERNREFQKSLLSAGPSELLRKMVAYQLSRKPGGITPGQFMAMSPAMRGDAAQLDTRFDPHMMDLRREQNILHPDRSANEENERRSRMNEARRKENQRRVHQNEINGPWNNEQPDGARLRPILSVAPMLPMLPTHGEPGGGTSDAFVQKQLELSKAITEQMGRMKDMSGLTAAGTAAKEFGDAVRGAVENLSNLASLKELPGIIAAIRGMVSAPGVPVGWSNGTRNPQAMGLTAGTTP